MALMKLCLIKVKLWVWQRVCKWLKTHLTTYELISHGKIGPWLLQILILAQPNSRAKLGRACKCLYPCLAG